MDARFCSLHVRFRTMRWWWTAQGLTRSGPMQTPVTPEGSPCLRSIWYGYGARGPPARPVFPQNMSSQGVSRVPVWGPKTVGRARRDTQKVGTGGSSNSAAPQNTQRFKCPRLPFHRTVKYSVREADPPHVFNHPPQYSLACAASRPSACMHGRRPISSFFDTHEAMGLTVCVRHGGRSVKLSLSASTTFQVGMTANIAPAPCP